MLADSFVLLLFLAGVLGSSFSVFKGLISWVEYFILMTILVMGFFVLVN